MAMPVQSPCARMPSSDSRRRSASVPPWTIGHSVWRPGAAPTSSSCRLAAARAASAACAPSRRGVSLVRRLARGKMIERHRDVGAERPLDLHRPLRREPARRPVDVGDEFHAVFVELAQRAERKDLEAARVGQDRLLPGGESVQPAQRGDGRLAGAQVQVIGVAEQDLRAGALDFGGMQSAHRAASPDRHEARRTDHAVRQRQRAGARRAVACRPAQTRTLSARP